VAVLEVVSWVVVFWFVVDESVLDLVGVRLVFTA